MRARANLRIFPELRFLFSFSPTPDGLVLVYSPYSWHQRQTDISEAGTAEEKEPIRKPLGERLINSAQLGERLSFTEEGTERKLDSTELRSLPLTRGLKTTELVTGLRFEFNRRYKPATW